MSYTDGDDLALDAEVEGRFARRRGEPLNSNPYLCLKGTLRVNWNAGWIDEDKWLREGADEVS